jgi:hypothetical protein
MLERDFIAASDHAIELASNDQGRIHRTNVLCFGRKVARWIAVHL